MAVKCMLSNPNTNWNYCPALAPAILFAILFLIVSGVHLWQAIRFRKGYAWVIIMAGAWEVAGYVFRGMSVLDQLSSWKYTAQFLLILLAPLWVNAFIYMILGRMLHFYLERDVVFGVRARRITLMFVLFDVTAFLVQLAGGTMTSGTGLSSSEIQRGLDIYMGGVVLQLCFNTIFLGLIIRFQRHLKEQNKNQVATPQAYEGLSYADSDTTPFAQLEGRTYRNAFPLLRCVYIALGIVVFRNLYRLVEYALGTNSTITRHEWFQYVFDAVPMLFAIIVLSIWHPGMFMQGPRSDFSEENKAKKLAKADKKAQKKADKQQKKADKQQKKGKYQSLDSQSGESLILPKYEPQRI